MTVRWTVRAAEDRARSSRENRVLDGPPIKTSSEQGEVFNLSELDDMPQQVADDIHGSAVMK